MLERCRHVDDVRSILPPTVDGAHDPPMNISTILGPIDAHLPRDRAPFPREAPGKLLKGRRPRRADEFSTVIPRYNGGLARATVDVDIAPQVPLWKVTIE